MWQGIRKQIRKQRRVMTRQLTAQHDNAGGGVIGAVGIGLLNTPTTPPARDLLHFLDCVELDDIAIRQSTLGVSRG